MDDFAKRRKRRRQKKQLTLLYIFVISLTLSFVGGFFTGKGNTEKSVEADISAAATIPDDITENAPAPADNVGKRQELLNALEKDFLKRYTRDGVELSFYIKDLRTGAFLEYNNKKRNSASVIKLFIMLEAYRQDAAGSKLKPEIEAALERMITESHNESTNMLIDEYSFEGINKTALDLGFFDTELQRKVFDKGSPTGKHNFSSVRDAGRLLEQIFRGECISEEYSKKMLNLLGKQKRVNKIPKIIKDVRPEVRVYNKTGELSSVENDCAIISSENFDFIFCVFEKITEDYLEDGNNKLKEALQEDIAKMAIELVEFFDRPA